MADTEPDPGDAHATRKPTPVRELASGEGRTRPAVADEAEVEVDGERWVVRVLGSSAAGPRGRAPLVLLGFWPAGALPDATTHDREALAVGGSLADFSPVRLEELVREGRPPPAPGRDRSFFSEASERRRR